MKDRRLIIFILLLVILTVDFIMTIYDKIDYEKRKASGNEKCLALYYYPTSASTPPSKIYVRIVLMKTDGFTPGEKILV